MALAQKVIDRYARQFLIQITNPHENSATQIDKARLDAACTDVIADIALRCAATYDDTDATHVTVAVEGVIYKLQMRLSSTNAIVDKLKTQWEDRLFELASYTGRKRLLPVSKSTLNPTHERVGSKPTFDSTRFRDTSPDQRDWEDGGIWPPSS